MERHPTLASRIASWTVALLALALGAGCGPDSMSGGARTQLRPRAGGNVVLCVSDQSFALDHVDITIRIDGKVAVAGEFAVGNEHDWSEYRFRLAPGPHRLTAISHEGKARIATSFRVHRELYGVVDYWYSPGNPGGARKLTFASSLTPFGFA